MANDSRYGLAHAVMSADIDRCERVASQLQVSPPSFLPRGFALLKTHDSMCISVAHAAV